MQPKAGFVQIGTQYFGTVVMPGSRHETILEDHKGKKIVFDSATRAMTAAQKKLMDFLCPPIRSEVIVQDGEEHYNEIKDWKARKADEARRSKDAFALRRTIVVRKKKFSKAGAS